MRTNSLLELSSWKKDHELTMLLSLLKKDAAPWQRTFAEIHLHKLDWTRLLRLAEHHRVVPLIYLQLKKSNHPAIPASLLGSLQAQYQRNTLRMLHLQAEAARLTRLLIDHGLRVFILKGPALAQQLYGDVSLRTSKDIDLLIAPDDMDEAEHWIREAGYESKSGETRVLGSWKWKDHHTSFLHPQKRMEVELHWRLHPDAGGEPSFDELWDRRQFSEPAGASRRASADSMAAMAASTYTLGGEHQFLYLSAHGARHGWFRLRWLVDIDRLAVCAVDWEALLLMLRRHGGLPAGGQAWKLAAALLGTPIPEPMRPISETRQAHRLALSALAFMQASVPAPHPVASGTGANGTAASELSQSIALTQPVETAPSDGGVSVGGAAAGDAFGEAALHAVSDATGIAREVGSVTGDTVNTLNTAVSSLTMPVASATVASSSAVAGATAATVTSSPAVAVATATAVTPQPISRAYLLSLKEPRHRLLYLISRLFPSTGDPILLPLPRKLHFLYIPLRPFLWLKRRFSKH
ncbi:nucleotidyltransferase family protein [Paenibacillus kribbensis]|uniref:nucleotidyltransferase domain-containing protein n=1 Tax=Paenibacillus kribbensis TaxID=172713 RepID=UPI002DBB1B36|nr:nucleotidyltransferase family protein [Paenibacillus kribbensis]MEC0233147.1 nucleotidyltransferase family protein [Paenibacillus kribbensis]